MLFRSADCEVDPQNQGCESVDLIKAELWANKLLYEYWDNKFPVDPNNIAVKMGMEVYFVPIPGKLAGLILKDDRESSVNLCGQGCHHFSKTLHDRSRDRPLRRALQRLGLPEPENTWIFWLFRRIDG